MSNKYEICTNSKNKKVSVCFLDGDAFDALIDGMTEEQLVAVYEAVDTTFLAAVENEESNLKKYLRTVARFDGKKATQKLADDARIRAEKCEEKLESWKEENNPWARKLQGKVLRALGEEEEEEEE